MGFRVRSRGLGPSNLVALASDSGCDAWCSGLGSGLRGLKPTGSRVEVWELRVHEGIEVLVSG